MDFDVKKLKWVAFFLINSFVLFHFIALYLEKNNYLLLIVIILVIYLINFGIIIIIIYTTLSKEASVSLIFSSKINNFINLKTPSRISSLF